MQELIRISVQCPASAAAKLIPDNATKVNFMEKNLESFLAGGVCASPFSHTRYGKDVSSAGGG